MLLLARPGGFFQTGDSAAREQGGRRGGRGGEGGEEKGGGGGLRGEELGGHNELQLIADFTII